MSNNDSEYDDTPFFLCGSHILKYFTTSSWYSYTYVPNRTWPYPSAFINICSLAEGAPPPMPPPKTHSSPVLRAADAVKHANTCSVDHSPTAPSAPTVAEWDWLHWANDVTSSRSRQSTPLHTMVQPLARHGTSVDLWHVVETHRLNTMNEPWCSSSKIIMTRNHSTTSTRQRIRDSEPNIYKLKRQEWH